MNSQTNLQEAAASASPRSLRLPFWAVLGIALVLPLWVVKYPPLIDYPDHLARAYILHHLHDSNQLFGQWYSSDWGANPYLVADLLLQAFQFPFGIYIAGKIVLTICVAGLPLATWLFLKKASPGNEYLALWSLVVSYHINFLMAFLSFELSIVLCFLVVALWLHWLDSPKLATWLRLMALVTLLYFTHLGGFAVAGLILTLYTLLKLRSVAQLWKSWPLFLPGATFSVYMRMHSWSKRGFDYHTWNLSNKVMALTTPLRGYSHLVDAVTILVLTAAIFFAIYKNPDWSYRSVWVLITLAILSVHWILPDRMGDLASIDTRFPPFAFLTALAIPSFGKRKNIMIASALALFVLRTANISQHFLAEQKRLQAYAAGIAATPEHSVVLAFNPAEGGAWVKRSELHFWAYGIIEKGWVSPTIFHQKGVQPIVLEKSIYLGENGEGGYDTSKALDWDRVHQDYDLIWAYGVPELEPALSSISRIDYSAGKLDIYRIRKNVEAPRSADDPAHGDESHMNATATFVNRATERTPPRAASQ